jgi:mono/diheme cytochrome c family protein
MHKRSLVVTLLLCSVGALTQDGKHIPKTAYAPIPVTEARRPNPIQSTPASIDSGKKIYGYECAQCHGISGDGKTRADKEMRIPDLSDPTTLQDRTDGEIFYVIKNGRGNMPLEGDRSKPEQIWDLVNYVRTLAKKTPREEKPPSPP